jgi:hypothetical protein
MTISRCNTSSSPFAAVRKMNDSFEEEHVESERISC